MNRFLDNWATNHRNAKALFTVIGITIVLVWSLVMKKQLDSHTLLRTDQIIATISKVHVAKTEGHSRYRGKYKDTTYIVKIDLPNKKHVRFMLQQKPPKEGTKVPVLVDVYDDGDNHYHYNLMEWQLL